MKHQNTSGQPAAVVLLSGGLDSTTTLAMALTEGFRVFALTVRYGQRNAIELDAARRVARAWGVADHIVIDVDLGRFGGSALTDDIDVPKDNDPADMAGQIPVTYVPARNTVFLSLALAWAEVLGAEHVFLGVNAVDYSGYPDCRPEFIDAFQRMANLATRGGAEGTMHLKIRTPLSEMTKAEIIRTGLGLGVDYEMTASCYDPSDTGGACGRCDACILRKRGFQAAGAPDPTRYEVVRRP